MSYTKLLTFNDEDDSIVFKSSMKTDESITSIGSGSLVEDGAATDSELGIKAGLLGGCMFLGHDTTGLDRSHQISFDVESDLLAENLASNGSTGSPKLGTYYVFTSSEVDQGAPYNRFRISTAEQAILELTAQTGTDITCEAHSQTDRFTRVTFNSIDGVTAVYYNGTLKGIGANTVSDINSFKYLYIGGLQGKAYNDNTRPTQDWYIKDFLVSNKAYQPASNYKLSNIHVVGDSFARQSDERLQGGWYGSNGMDALIGKLRVKGFDVGFTTNGSGGAVVLDGTGNSIETMRDIAGGPIDTKADLTFFFGGSNDAIQGVVTAQVNTDLKNHMTQLLTTSHHVIIPTIPTLMQNPSYDNAAHRGYVNTMNGYIRALADFDSRIIVVDIEPLLGGHTTGNGYFAGEIISTDATNIHPSPKAWLVYADQFEKAVMSALG